VRLLADDGVILYLNGDEVFRLRMPAGPVDYNTLATFAQGDAQNIFEGPYDLPASALIAGTNLFAAELHQATTTSSDVSFTAQLILELPSFGFPAPLLAFARDAGGTLLIWNDSSVLQESPTVTGPWSDISPAAASPYSVTGTSTNRFFRLRVP